MKLKIGTNCALSKTPIKEIKIEEVLHQDVHTTKVPRCMNHHQFGHCSSLPRENYTLVFVFYKARETLYV